MVNPSFILAAAITTFFAGAVLAFLTASTPRIAAGFHAVSLTVGCALGFSAVAAAAWMGYPTSIAAFLDRALGIDPLSALFIVITLFICLCAGLCSESYARRSESLSRSKSRRSWFLMLTAAMLVVVSARRVFIFLSAWELMALASFFLVILEDAHAQVRRAGLLYFICMHTGTLALFLFFSLLGHATGTFDFQAIRDATRITTPISSALLPLALLGFGMKAGIVPFHIWLQEAHPAAPSYVSAVMSGAVIKMGIYGFLRIIWMVRWAPQSWAACLIILGSISGIGGVLFALAQHDLKRLLAYHSVENIGIIVLGLGLGCLGLSQGRLDIAVLGFGGAALHTLNHGLFKSLLFLGSGSFQQELGTRDIEAGGGLLKTMPWTSSLSLIGAAAISGIPPLNGFISEWLVFMAGIAAMSTSDAWMGGLAIGSLALIGGLALACFTKAYGTLCLGHPRTSHAVAANDPGPEMLWPMGMIAAACVLIGLWPNPALAVAFRAAAFVSSAPIAGNSLALNAAASSVRFIGLAGAAVIACACVLALIRSALLKNSAAYGPTWACGFWALTPRAQYTASSFARPLTLIFDPILGSRVDQQDSLGYWPADWSYLSHTPDRILDGLLRPAFHDINGGLAQTKRRMRSRPQYYILTASLFLLLLLIWKL
ncbi:MAG: proton-conducting transporter transmembrane domain-containing protein [Elusimicrobiota bacterium]